MNGWSDDTEQRRLNEPPLPPELSPRRAAAAAGGVPPQSDRRAQPGGGSGGGPWPPATGGNGGSGPRRPRWSMRKKIGWTALGLVVVLLVVSVSTYFWADSKVRREVDLSKVEDRPHGGQGHQLSDRRLRQP